MRRLARLATAQFAGLALLGLSEHAWAEPRARLEYLREESAAECPAASALESAVQARLGEDPFAPNGQRVFQVRVLAQGDRLVGLVTLLDAQGLPEGLRRFEGTQGHCDELIAALALAISIAINPELADVGASSAAETPAAEQPPSAPPPPAPPVASSAPRAAESKSTQPARASVAPSWGVALGLEGHLAIGAGPEPAAGVGVLGRVRSGPASIGLELRFDLPSDHPVGDAVVFSRLLGGSLVPCFHLGPGFACAVLLLADVQAGSDGVTDPETDNGLFVAAGPRLGLGATLAPGLSLELRLDALLMLKPVEIVLNHSQVWESPWLSGALGAALVWQLP